MSSPPEPAPGHDALWLECESILDRFETAWQERGRASMGEFLPPPESGLRARVLHELVKIDLEYRWDRGEEPGIEEYVSGFPELLEAGMAPLDLIGAELHLRQFHHRPLSSEDLLKRFPSQQAAVAALLVGGSPTPTGTDQADAAAAPRKPRQIFSPREAPAEPSQNPRRLGRYEIREQIGRGGSSTVYRAWDPELQRDVAIKVPHPAFMADEEFGRRLLREASSAAQLRHPAIVPIHEVGQTGDQPFIVYEFIAGSTLAKQLAQSRPSPAQAAALMVRIAEAVDYAHQCGIVHRDLKPGNIMMDRDGQPLLADFGLALKADDAATLTQQGDILGTPGYMSPEQASGRGHEVDGRSDVYSLGVIFYQMLCGVLPFQGSGADVLHRVIHDEPTPPRQRAASTPRDLETICLTAMAKEPNGRYVSAAALAADLRHYLAHEPILARPVGLLGRIRRWRRRQPALAATVSGALVVIAATAAVAFWQVLLERDNFRLERDRAESNLYRALVGEARAQARGRDSGWWHKAMADVRQAARLPTASRDPIELRELAVQLMGTLYPSFDLRATLQGNAGPVSAVAISSDDTLLFSGAGDGTVRLWTLPEGRPLSTGVHHNKAVTAVAISPKGDQAASSSVDGIVCLWGLSTKSTQLLAKDKDLSQLELVRSVSIGAGAIRAVVYTRDGQWLAVACDDGKVRLLAAHDEHAPFRMLEGHTQRVASLAISPSEEILASGGFDRTIRFWDLASGKQTMAWPVLNNPTSLAYGAAGLVLSWADDEAFGFGSRSVQGNHSEAHSHEHAGELTSVLFDQRDRFYTASMDGTIKLWRKKSSSLLEFAVARDNGSAIRAAAVTKTSGMVCAGCADGAIRLWELTEPPQRSLSGGQSQSLAFVGTAGRVVSKHWFDCSQGLPTRGLDYSPSPLRALAIQPGDRLIACADNQGKIQIWDWHEHVRLQSWRGHDQAVLSLAAHPDGTRFASSSDDGSIKVWNWRAGSLVKKVEPNLGHISTVAWSPDGKRLAALGEHRAEIWEDENGRLLGSVTAEENQRASALAVGSDVIAIAWSSGGIDIWNSTMTARLSRLRGKTAQVSALAFAADGKKLASASGDGAIRVWDVDKSQEEQSMTFAGAPPRWLQFQPGGHYLVSGCLPIELTRVWDLRVGVAVAGLHGSADGCAAFTSDGSTLLLGAQTGAVRVCRLADVEKAIGAVVGQGVRQLGVNTVRIDLPEVAVPGGHQEDVWGIAASPDGHWFATAGHDRSVKLWDAQTMELVRTFEGHDTLVWCVAFSADSKLLASGSSSIKIWDVATGKELHNCKGHKRLITGLAFHPQKPWLFSCSYDGTVRVWDTATGRALGVLHRFDNLVFNLCLRPDGRWLAAACHDRAALWDLEAIEPTSPCAPGRTLAESSGQVWSVRFSPDGRLFATGSEEGVITLRDGETFDQPIVMRSDIGQIRALSFSQNSQFLAATGYPSTMLVWDLGQVRQTLRGLKLDW